MPKRTSAITVKGYKIFQVAILFEISMAMQLEHA